MDSLHQPLGMQSPEDSSMRPSPGEIQTLAGAETNVPVGEGGGCHTQGMAVRGCTASVGQLSFLLSTVFNSDISLLGTSLHSWSWQSSLEQVSGANKAQQQRCSPKCFGRAPWKVEFYPSALCQTKHCYPGLSPMAQQASAARSKQGREKFQCPEILLGTGPSSKQHNSARCLCPPLSRVRSCKQLKHNLILRLCKTLPFVPLASVVVQLFFPLPPSGRFTLSTTSLPFGIGRAMVELPRRF